MTEAQEKVVAPPAQPRRSALMVAAVSVAILVATGVAPPRPRLVWNASASATIGLYAVSPGADIRPDDMVIAWAPARWRTFAAHRHYLPSNVPLVKRVAAVEGDFVCALGQEIFVNGRWITERHSRDGKGHLMPWWSGCHKLVEGELFLLIGDNAASFDGRYFGISKASDVIGRARLLWAR